MEIFIFWIVFSIVAGVIASNKGRSGVGFFFLALLLSPLIGIVGALVAQKKETGPVKPCPYCAETIKAQAVVCRFCGKSLEETVEQEANTPAREVEAPEVEEQPVFTSDDDPEQVRRAIMAKVKKHLFTNS